MVPGNLIFGPGADAGDADVFYQLNGIGDALSGNGIGDQMSRNGGRSVVEFIACRC